MIAVDLRKQQILGANPRANQQINFKVNLDRGGENTYTISSLKKEEKLN